MAYEVIQPVSGANIFSEFLDTHDEGIHHIAGDMHNVPFCDRIKFFESRGFKMAQRGKLDGQESFRLL